MYPILFFVYGYLVIVVKYKDGALTTFYSWLTRDLENRGSDVNVPYIRSFLNPKISFQKINFPRREPRELKCQGS